MIKVEKYKYWIEFRLVMNITTITNLITLFIMMYIFTGESVPAKYILGISMILTSATGFVNLTIFNIIRKLKKEENEEDPGES